MSSIAYLLLNIAHIWSDIANTLFILDEDPHIYHMQ